MVLDTNIVLDLLVFDDPATHGLKGLLVAGEREWHATAAMREELQRVLHYRHIAARMALAGTTMARVLARYDDLSRTSPVPPSCAVRCRDRDDQIFIDLAAARRAVLMSKDCSVLRLRKRLARLGVVVSSAIGADDTQYPGSTSPLVR